PVPMAKVMAESRKGGTVPEASVSRASSAHMATAEKPISVARPIRSPSRRAGRLPRGLEPLRADRDRPDLGADRCMDGGIYTGLADRSKRDHDAAAVLQVVEGLLALPV